MTADNVTRLLIELINRLPPDMRPLVGSVLRSAAVSQPYWTPVAVLLLAGIVIGLLRLYVESLDG